MPVIDARVNFHSKMIREKMLQIKLLSDSWEKK